MIDLNEAFLNNVESGVELTVKKIKGTAATDDLNADLYQFTNFDQS